MRLDNYLVEKGYFDSRTKAKQAVERGEIFIEGKVITRPAHIVLDVQKRINVERICEESFVSLGGFKLKKALVDFKMDVNGMIIADLGASTGGFTDCLLKHGAKKVYSVDLNDNLLHESLKKDKRVTTVVKNAKELNINDFTESLDMIVADLSFISVTCVMNVFSKLLDCDKKLLLLIKPQFETGGKKRFKNGIIRDKKVHEQVLKSTIDCAEECGFNVVSFTTAPICKDKNVEFLALFVKNENTENA